jgi:hypothetical protein
MNDSKFSKRQLVVAGLVLFALLWVLLMGIADAVGGSSTAVAAAPGISGRSSAAARAPSSFPRDGSLNAKVTSVDRDKAHVSLTVNVTDKDGKVARDLTDKEFEIYENGMLAKVVKFTPAGSTGVRVALAVDYGDYRQIGADQRELILAGTRSLVNALKDGDHLGLYLNNHYALQQGYREAVPMGPLDAARRDQTVKRLDNLRQFYAGSGIFPTMGLALSKLAETRGRRVLIVLSPGWDNLAIAAIDAPTKDIQQKKLEEEKKAITDLIYNAQKAGIPLYMVYPVGTVKAQEDVLKQLGTDSGGEYYAAVGAAKLTDYLIGVTENLRNEYTLEYDSPNPKEDGTQRKVNVVIRSATAGANTAEGGYRMPGVLASESSSTTDSATTPAGTTPATKKSSSGVFGVFFPLLLLLLLLFAVPYLFWLMPKGRNDQDAPAAASPPVATAVPTGPAPLAAAHAPAAVLISPPKTPPPAAQARPGLVLPKVAKPLPKSNNNVPIAKPAPGAKRPPGR